MTVWAGIDPGKNGAIAKICDDEIIIVGTPTIQVTRTKKQYDLRAMYELLSDVNYVCIELQGGRPGISTRALSSIMLGFGYWEMAITIEGIPHKIISPQSWKKHFGVTKDKNTSIYQAKKLFPCANMRPNERCKKDSADFAEALLLAAYCREKFNFKSST